MSKVPVGTTIGGICGLVAGGGLEALFRKTAQDINAIVIARTGWTKLHIQAATELAKQYRIEVAKGGLHGFLAWKIYDHANHGGGTGYGHVIQVDPVVIFFAGIVGAIIGAVAARRGGWALVLIVGLAAWGISGGGGGIYILGNVLGRAVVLIGGAIGGAIALITLEMLRRYQR